MANKNKETFPCADNNSDHQFAMARYWVKCKRCRVYRQPTFFLYGERTVAPKTITKGMTEERFNAWLNKLNADYIERDDPRYG